MDLGSTVFAGKAKHFNMVCYVASHVGWKLGKPCQLIWQEEVVDLTVKHFGNPFKAIASVSHVSFYPAYGAVVHWRIAAGGKVSERVSRPLSQFPDSFSWQFHGFTILIFDWGFQFTFMVI